MTVARWTDRRPGDPTVILAGSPPDGEGDGDDSEYEYEYYYDDDDEYYYDDEEYEDEGEEEDEDVVSGSGTTRQPQATSFSTSTRWPPETTTVSAIIPRGRGGLSNRLESRHFDLSHQFMPILGSH